MSQLVDSILVSNCSYTTATANTIYQYTSQIRKKYQLTNFSKKNDNNQKKEQQQNIQLKT